MTRLAQLIAKEEGFGIAGAIPTTHHNPGDLRHSPHSQHPGDPNAVGTIDTDAHGWADLQRQLQIYAEEGFTLRQMVNVYLGLPPDAPASAADVDNNNRAVYLTALCSGLGMNPDTKVAEALKIMA